MKAYHFAMVPEKSGGLSTLIKLGLVAGGVYLAYKRLPAAEEKDTDTVKESFNAGTPGVNLGLDTAAREVNDFADRVLRAAKRLPNAIIK